MMVIGKKSFLCRHMYHDNKRLRQCTCVHVIKIHAYKHIAWQDGAEMGVTPKSSNYSPMTIETQPSPLQASRLAAPGGRSEAKKWAPESWGYPAGRKIHLWMILIDFCGLHPMDCPFVGRSFGQTKKHISWMREMARHWEMSFNSDTFAPFLFCFGDEWGVESCKTHLFFL